MPTYKFICRKCEDTFEKESEELMLMTDIKKICESICKKCGEVGYIEHDTPFGGNFTLRYTGSTIQSNPKIREFKETVLDPIKRGLGKSGRVNNIE